MFDPKDYIQIIFPTTQYRALKVVLDPDPELVDTAEGKPVTGHFSLAGALAAKASAYDESARRIYFPTTVFATVHITVAREVLQQLVANGSIEAFDAGGQLCQDTEIPAAASCLINQQGLAALARCADFSMKLVSGKQALEQLAQTK